MTKKGMGVGSSQQGRGATATPQDEIDTAERTKRVVELRLAGATFQQIADRVGYSQASAAYKCWQRAMADIPASSKELARSLELARLDAMLTAVWPACLRGQLGAIDRALNIGRRRARLLGLDAPVRVDGSLSDSLSAEVERLALTMAQLDPDGKALAEANERDKS